MTTRVAVYARQSAYVEEGVADQIRRCTALVEAKGWTVAGVYQDNDTSATKPRADKTDWARMLNDGRAGLFTHVVAVDMDRLLRTISDLARIFDIPGLRIVTVDGEIDTASADGEYRATQLAAAARFEIRRKTERRVRRNEARRANGVPNAGRPPFGYSWVPARDRDGDLVTGMPWAPVPEQLALVREAYERARLGESLGSLTASMNAATGLNWSRTTTRRMLLNPAYAALVPPRSEPGSGHYDAAKIDPNDCMPGAWEPAVPRETWDAVRAIVLAPARSSHTGSRARKWLLGGLAVCGVCGEPVRSCVTREGHRGYRCRSMGHFIRRAQAIDAHVTLEMLKVLSRPEVLAVLHPEDDTAELRAEAVELRSRLDDLALSYASGAITRRQLDVASQRLNERLRANAEAQSERAVATTFSTVAIGADLPMVWADLPLATKREVIQVLARRVIIDPVGKGRGRANPAETVRIEWGA
ncbi:recombinase family protein [Cellulomonas sp. zg-ZUI222]|uniref:recombinase family protein n=1 Tax=Cellulomonas wangleii TaxID=2816956 RepID=UPI001A940222|nr:recombinase family protein [Cellulomonas wangleii]MBO0920359.1 recombinase family protein [Cellulomonas wangleii]